MGRILWIFLVSRIGVLLLIGCMKWLFGFPEEMPDQIHLDHPILNILNLYDSYNYAQITMEGYSEERLTVFFPLFPLMTRALVMVGLDVYAAGVLLSNLFFLGSLWAFDHLMIQRGVNLHIRRRILWVLSLFPSSFYLGAFYTESLFLYIALLSFLMWGKGKKEWAYLLGGLAATTRVIGVFIPLAFFLDQLLHRKMTWKDVLFSFFSFLIFAMYPGYLWVFKGDPFLFISAQDYYFRIPGYPFEAIWADVQNLINSKPFQPLILIHFVVLIFIIFYIWTTIRSNQLNADFLFAMGAIVLPLSSVSTIASDIATHGLIRYILPAFPFFIFLGKQWEEWRKSRIKLYLGITVWVFTTVYCYSVLSMKGFLA